LYINISCVFVQLVAQLINPAVNPNEVRQFLWQHMRCDIDTVHTAVGCSLDDVLVLVHLLLKHALETGGRGGLLPSFLTLVIEYFTWMHLLSAECQRDCYFPSTRMVM